MAVTVTYFIRGGGVTINGSVTPPSGQQAAQVATQKAVVVFGASADVRALFTHNWGLDASAPGYFDPQISVEPLSANTYWPSLTFDVTNTNAVAINKATGDAGTTVVITLRKPNSIGQ